MMGATLTRCVIGEGGVREEIGSWSVRAIRNSGESTVELRRQDTARRHVAPAFNLRIRSAIEKNSDGEPLIIWSLIMEATQINWLGLDWVGFEGFVEVNPGGEPFRDFDYEDTDVYQREEWVVRR